MELGPRSDAKLQAATITLWEHDSLEGCFSQMNIEPSDQSVISSDQSEECLGETLFGIASTPNGHKIPCSSSAARFDPLDSKPATDWLYFGLPIGGLEIAYQSDVDVFYGIGSNKSFVEVNDWLRDVGFHVFSGAPFQFGMIGWEVPLLGESAKWIAENGIPETPTNSLLVPSDGELQWTPGTG